MGCHHLLTHALAGSGAFFAFGLAGGIHCAAMCGPLACLLGGGGRPLPRLVLHQAGRIAAYAGVGATFAALGSPLRPVLTWPVLAAVAGLPLLVFAAKPQWLELALPPSWMAAGARLLGGLPANVRALALGLLTPGLPCGLLYAAAGACLAAPTWAVGAGWMACFAAGTLPALALSIAGFTFAAHGRGPAAVLGVRRAAAAVAACTILALAFLG
jgi:sulfite exporter TauE/SafE